MGCLGRLVDISIKIPEELRELMKRININWSMYLREAIEAKVREELAKEASRELDEIRARARRTPTEAIVRWIRKDREQG